MKQKSILKNSGQTMIELLIAVGFFAIFGFGVSVLVVDGLFGAQHGEETSIATFLAQEGLDATKSIRDEGWTNMISGNHGLSDTGGSWVFSGASELIDAKYTRVINVADVQRDGSGTIVLTGGIVDGRTKLVTSTVTWTGQSAVPRSVGFQNYLLDWGVFDWQEDTDIEFSDGTLTSTEIKLAGDPSYVQLLAGTGGGVDPSEWQLGGGPSFTDTSNTDFDQGTYSGTQVTGSGTPAKVVLDTAPQWDLFDFPFGTTGLEFVTANWAMGKNGKMYSWTGSQWVEVPSGTTQTITSMWEVSINEVYATGKNGTLLRWDGVSWTTLSSPTGQDINGVAMTSSSNGFGVGDNGVITQWNGTSWSTIASPTGQDLKAVSMVSANNGFAVGDNGVIVQWDGTTWNTVTTPTGQDINSVQMLSATQGYAVGNNGVMLQWDGTSWTTMTSPTGQNLNSVSMLSSTSGFAVGDNGVMLQWNGSAWATMPALTGQDFKSVTMISATDGWAVGKNGVVFRWNGSEWLPYTQASTNQYNAAAYVTTNDAFIVGNGGVIVHWDGLTWANQTSNTNQDLKGVSFASSIDGFAVGKNGEIIRWNGTAWATITSPTGQDLDSVNMISSSDGFAVGKAGTIIRWNGSAWASVTSPTGQDLKAVDMISSSDGFAVGKNGEIIRWNGTAWATITSPTGNNLQGVYMLSATDGWAVGDGGLIIQWNGTAWSSVTSPTTQNLQAITMVSVSEGYAVGSNGTVIKWNGTAWATETSPTAENLRGLIAPGSNNAWGVGDLGTIIKLGLYYTSPGTFLSRIFDSTNVGTSWDLVHWAENNFSVTDLTIATRTGNTVIPDGSWSAWSGELTNAAGSSITSPNGRYLQYRITLTTTDIVVSPELENITIVYNTPSLNTDINDVTMISVSDGFAVGNSGKTLRWNGATWGAITSPTPNALEGVAMVSSSDGWAVGAGGTILQWLGSAWGLYGASPTITNLNALSMASSSVGWVVGNGGYLGVWDGLTWANGSTPTANNLYDIYMLSTSDGWAVGAGGTILQWDGATWVTVTSPIIQDLWGVDCVASNDCQAVGASGKILHYNGTAWSEINDSGSMVLTGIDMVSANQGYIVGDAGLILKWDGVSWLLDISPATTNLLSVSMGSTTDGWAVGATGTFVHYAPPGVGSTPAVITDDTQGEFNLGTYASTQWNTDHVELVSPATTGTYSSQVFDSGNALSAWSQISWSEDLTGGNLKMEAGSATANGTFSTVNLINTYTSPVVIPLYNESANSGPLSVRLRNVGANSFQLALTSPAAPAGSQVVQTTDTDFNAGTYSNTEVLGTGIPASVYITENLIWENGSVTGAEDVEDISMISATDGWAAAKLGDVYHFNGTTWTSQTTPAGDDLKGIDAVDASNVWAVGKGPVVTYYNGSTWANQTNPAGDDLEDLDMVSTSFGVAVGRTGTIIHWNGSAWSSVTSPTTERLRDVSMISTTDGFIVGRVPVTTAVILRWNGTTWSSVTSPSINDLESVAMYDANFGIAVGKIGTIIHWNGTAWSNVTSPTGEDLKGVDVLSPTDAVAVGKAGTILHWNGTVWAVDTSSTGQDINSVSYVATNDIWAGAKGPTFPHYRSDYTSPGTFTSSVIDSGDNTTQWDLIAWSEDISPTGTDVVLDTRTGNTATPDGSWSAWSGTYTTPAGETIISPDARYAQYRVTFTTTVNTNTSSIGDVTIDYSLPGPTINSDTVDYLVVEEGAWTLPGGLKMEAHNVSSSALAYKSNWVGATQNYTNSYASPPVVLHSLQTNNDSTWAESVVFGVGSRTSLPSNTGFDLAMNGAEAITTHASETIGWVAFETGTGTIGATNFEASITTDTVRGHDNGCYNFSFTNTYASNPLVLADQQKMDSNDGSWGVGCALSTTQIGLHAEEDQQTDSERAHTTEPFAFVAFEQDFDFADAVDITFQTRSCNDALCSGETYVGPDGTGATVFTNSAGEGLSVGINQYFQYQGTFTSNGSATPKLNSVTINYATPAGGGGSGYPASGTYISGVVNSDSTLTTWETLFWNEVLPLNTDVTIAVRAGNVPVPDGSWAAWSIEHSMETGSDINLAGQYLQYRATLSSNDSLVTPKLEYITATYR